MKLTFLILCLCYTSIMSAQTPPKASGSDQQYLFNITDSLSGKLTLMDSKKYLIELCYAPYNPYDTSPLNGDIAFESYLSYGKYVRKKDTLILKDELFGYTIHVVKADSCIEFLSAFPFLKNLPLKNIVDSEIEAFSLPEVKFSDDSLRKLIASEKQHDENQISIGIHYKTGEYYELFLDPGNVYKWNLFSKTISQGTWTRDGNLLNFHDQCTGKAYHALIESPEKIRSVFMPGDYRGETLSIVSPKR